MKPRVKHTSAGSVGNPLVSRACDRLASEYSGRVRVIDGYILRSTKSTDSTTVTVVGVDPVLCGFDPVGYPPGYLGGVLPGLYTAFRLLTRETRSALSTRAPTPPPAVGEAVVYAPVGYALQWGDLPVMGGASRYSFSGPIGGCASAPVVGDGVVTVCTVAAHSVTGPAIASDSEYTPDKAVLWVSRCTVGSPKKPLLQLSDGVAVAGFSDMGAYVPGPCCDPLPPKDDDDPVPTHRQVTLLEFAAKNLDGYSGPSGAYTMQRGVGVGPELSIPYDGDEGSYARAGAFTYKLTGKSFYVEGAALNDDERMGVVLYEIHPTMELVVTGNFVLGPTDFPGVVAEIPAGDDPAASDETTLGGSNLPAHLASIEFGGGGLPFANNLTAHMPHVFTTGDELVMVMSVLVDVPGATFTTIVYKNADPSINRTAVITEHSAKRRISCLFYVRTKSVVVFDTHERTTVTYLDDLEDRKWFPVGYISDAAGERVFVMAAHAQHKRVENTPVEGTAGVNGKVFLTPEEERALPDEDRFKQALVRLDGSRSALNLGGLLWLGPAHDLNSAALTPQLYTVVQYAPGYAVAVTTTSSATTGTKPIKLVVFSVDTGAVLYTSAQLGVVPWSANVALTCINQGVIEDGEITHHARLILAVAEESYIVEDTSTIKSFSVNASRGGMFYLGSVVTPADIGVASRLSDV